MKHSRALFLVAVAAVVLFVPWLGNTYFYTKGEPREAIVAVSMLQSGDWVLPVSYGADMPYKPPMLAWLIAIFSSIFGGTVSEFTSRLPSALAAVALLVAGWRLVYQRIGSERAWVMMLVTATSFEFFRAATACRVDMVLTAFMVGAVYAIYTMRGRPLRALLAVLLLSGATLTKGPVGSLLPCLAMGLYFLLRGDNFWRTLGLMVALCVASFVLPALWYYAAWLRGGDEFMRLALEENVGRLTGTMTYDSHLNPWYYNVECVFAGMLPWTVPVVIALCYRSVRRQIAVLRVDKGLPLMAWTVGLTIFVFYCIPASKRSVYLLPCYPFLAYGATWVLMNVNATRLIRVWTVIIAVIGVIAPIVFFVAELGYIKALPVVPLHWWLWPVAVAPLIVGLWWLHTRSQRGLTLAGVLWLSYVIFGAYNGAYMPMALNARSDYHAAQVVKQKVPDGEKIVSVIDYDDLLRYYSLNFYLGDRLRRVPTLNDVPDDAWLLTEPRDGLAGDTITAKSCDTRRPVILVRPQNKLKVTN
jgi:4-amino-4-deoxy-L-arabinose transferase-like glycosyltransferase